MEINGSNSKDSFIFLNGAYIVYYLSLFVAIINIVISILFLINRLYLFSLWSIICILLLPKSILGIIMLLGRNENIYLNLSPFLYNNFARTCQKYRFVYGKDVITGYIKEIMFLFIGISPILLYILRYRENIMKILSILILCLVLCLVLYLTALTNIATSQTFNETKENAEKGNAEAQFNLGLMYAKGHGVAQDFAKAKAWFEKAAAQGLAEAQTTLGVLYVQGQGVAQDFGKARAWYEKAADQGYAEAQTNLGALYAQGQGVSQDFTKAKAWFEKAAAQGVGKAQFNLGVLYYEGLGVAQDFGKAKAWYEKAAAQGNVEAQFNLGVLYAHGQGVAQNFAKARAWYEKAADQGFAPAKEVLKNFPK